MDFLSQNQGGGEAKPELVWLTGSGMNKSEQVDESMLFLKIFYSQLWSARKFKALKPTELVI